MTNRTRRESRADVFVARSRPEVFEYIARAALLPEYVMDFESVRQMSAGEPSVGTQYSYKLARRKIEGTFEWTEYEPHSRGVNSQPALTQIFVRDLNFEQ